MSAFKDLFEFGEHQPPRPHVPADDLDGIPPEVVAIFERLALEISRQGFTRYSSDAILHRIRWHMHLERGDREFKANDHWTARLSRWFLKKHPELPDFFETRRRPTTE